MVPSLLGFLALGIEKIHFLHCTRNAQSLPTSPLMGSVLLSAPQVLQLYQITQINHGLMMVGPSGSGKSMAWRVLLKALERLEGVEGVAHIIDPKAISKDHLYGTLDPNTREWTDGLFTHVLRKYVHSLIQALAVTLFTQ